MKRRQSPVLVALALALAITAAQAIAAEKVRWSKVERSYKPVSIPSGLHAPPDKPPAPPGSPPVRVTNVLLENEYVSIEVAVEAAGRVMHVTYKKDGTELFNVLEKLSGGQTWDGGGWRSSFPFREHGMRYTDQPTGWRVVEHDDGSVTLAMDMRFARFRARKELGRYGRFTHLRLGRSIALRPGQAYFEVTTTIENPLPYRYGYQLWSLAQFPHRSDAEFLLPVSRVSGHRLRNLRDWTWGQGMALHRNWDIHSSVFSINVTYPFAGVYYPSEDLNRLRIADPARLPGGKLYAWPDPSFFYELWTGSNHLFAQEGCFVEPFGRHSYTQRYYAARGIGRADYANEHFAVSFKAEGSGAAVRLLPVQDMQGVEYAVFAADGTRLAGMSGAARAMVPQVLRLPTSAPDAPVKVVATAGRQTLLNIQLPLAVPAPDPRQEAALRETISPDPADPRRVAESYEKRAWVGGRSANLASAALRAAMDWAQAEPDEPAAQVQLGRVLFMLGKFGDAAQSLQTALQSQPTDAQAHHLLGLVLLEQGDAQGAHKHFLLACSDAQAAPEAHYMVAIASIAAGDRSSAIEHLRKLVEVRPDTVRPQIVLAALLASQGATDEARKLASRLEQEDPSSPEVAYVLKLTEPQSPQREAVLAKLLFHNPEARQAVAQLSAEIEQGRWVHPSRPDVTGIEPVIPVRRSAARTATQPTSRRARRRDRTPRVLFLIGEGSEPDEFGMPYEALLALGYEIDIASPDQAFWAFSRSGARYIDDEALISDDRLITASGASAVDQALKLLEKE